MIRTALGTLTLTLLLAAPALAQPADSAKPSAPAQQGVPAPTSSPDLKSIAYQRLSASEKRAILWNAIRTEGRYNMKKLPTRGAVTGAAKLIWGRLTLRSTFDDDLDVRRSRGKTFHRWGTSVAVRYEPLHQGMAGRVTGVIPKKNDYTGVFKEGAIGVARLSLGLGDVGKLWAPGIGLKLFIDGKPSVNIHAIPRDGGQPTKNFMAATLDTKIDPTPLDKFLKFSTGADPTHRKTDHVASVTPNGKPVANPKSPFRIEFRPGKSIQYTSAPKWGKEDFRVSLAKIPTGSVLYEVWAVETESQTSKDAVHIGNVRTQSAFAASEFQDRRLHFKHLR